MEKNKPHTPLAVIKALVEKGNIHVTRSAVVSAQGIGFRRYDVSNEVLQLAQNEFYKSMTTYASSAAWQDVYRHKIANGAVLYVKLMVQDDVLVVSFKEL